MINTSEIENIRIVLNNNNSSENVHVFRTRFNIMHRMSSMFRVWNTRCRVNKVSLLTVVYSLILYIKLYNMST